MAAAIDQDGAVRRKSVLRTPLVLMAIVTIILAVLLVLPISLPIGPMYWDLFVYFDAANRLFDGQTPSTDFFAPVGPLGYYLFAGGIKLFPHAQPLLLVHWSLFVVTGPLLALVLWQVDKRSRATALALLVPFLVYAILPFNTREFSSYPGSDGFGIYNRQVCQLLYVLTAGLVFLRGQRLLFVIIVAGIAALFATKITGFVSGGLLCAFAFAAGRVSLRTAVASALAFLALLAVLQLWNGFTLNYIDDILALVVMNEESLAPRFLQAASHTFGIVAPAGLLILYLLALGRDQIVADIGALRTIPSWTAVARLLDRDALWIGVALFAGIFFETQNTGSQALIFLWPVLLPALIKLWNGETTRRSIAIATLLVGPAALPPLVNTVERAARTYFGAIKNVGLPSDNLKTLGRINMRPEILARAEKMMDLYPRHRETYTDFVRIGELPAYMFYSEFDFQATLLMAMDHAVTDIKALEARDGVRFETILTLNFVNPIPWLMDRSAPLHVAIGADPTRAVPPPDAETLAAVRDTDLVLHPTCPPTTANAELMKLYAPALRDHKKITLDACYDAYVNPRLAGRIE